jgi:hypothetical protein
VKIDKFFFSGMINESLEKINAKKDVKEEKKLVII